MNAYKTKYSNGKLQLLEKPSITNTAKNAIVFFLEEPPKRSRAVKKNTPSSQKRPFGLCKNEFSVTNHFDDPLPESFLKAFKK